MGKLHYSYSDIHNLVKEGSLRLKNFKPDYIVAIAGGGLIPARMLRTFINVPIISLTISFYNENNQILDVPKILQWVDKETIKGKNILIVDEVDDTRKTLSYVVEFFNQNSKNLGVFVVNNKIKEKVYKIPNDVLYISCRENTDIWINYPWDNPNFIK
tara:strand:+ start:40 stop:513 length:474 start_codon:yes stop_codon:yes gene_type:complete